MTRTTLILFLAMLTIATALAAPATAKDGGDGGGGDGGGSGRSGGGDDGGDDGGGYGGDSNGGNSFDDDDDDDDSDRARAGVSSGAILPLSAILSGVETHFGARMIDAELDRKRGRMIYDLELITPQGRVLEVQVDAATARVIRVDD